VERNGDSGGGYEYHLQGFEEGNTKAISFGIRGIGVSVTKMEVNRDVIGGLGSKSKKWKLVVGDT